MKKNVMEIIVSISGMLGLILQFVDGIDNTYKIIIFIVFTIAFIITFILSIIENKSISKYNRIKKSNKFILNAYNEIILFGGNLSWTDDYRDCIKKKIDLNCIVKVYYDKRSHQESKQALSNLESRIKTLRDIGCEVNELNDNFNLRCTISDPDNKADSFKVLMIRKNKEDINPNNNRYAVTYADNKTNKELSILTQKIVKMAITNINVKSED